MTFTQMLAAAWQKNNSLLCVGLDPDPAKFPAHLKGRDDAILEFCTAIVDATADLEEPDRALPVAELLGGFHFAAPRLKNNGW